MSHDIHDGTDTANAHLAVIPRADGDPLAAPALSRCAIVGHHHAADRYWYLRLDAPQIARAAVPGQFVMLTIARDDEPGPVLPRPMAIYDTDPHAGYIDIMYGVVGAGTRRLCQFRVGEDLTVVGPLGRGFVLTADTRKILLIGRGIGTCSLTALASYARSRHVEVVAVDSARNPQALVAGRTYQRAGVQRLLQVTDTEGTSDPELLRTRLVGELDNDPPQQVYVCGSDRLMRLAADLSYRWAADMQVSLEAHMACGLGYCHGCSNGQRTADSESPLICRDGPVFRWTGGPLAPAASPPRAETATGTWG